MKVRKYYNINYEAKPSESVRYLIRVMSFDADVITALVFNEDYTIDYSLKNCRVKFSLSKIKSSELLEIKVGDIWANTRSAFKVTICEKSFNMISFIGRDGLNISLNNIDFMRRFYKYEK